MTLTVALFSSCYMTKHVYRPYALHQELVMLAFLLDIFKKTPTHSWFPWGDSCSTGFSFPWPSFTCNPPIFHVFSVVKELRRTWGWTCPVKSEETSGWASAWWVRREIGTRNCSTVRLNVATCRYYIPIGEISCRLYNSWRPYQFKIAW